MKTSLVVRLIGITVFVAFLGNTPAQTVVSNPPAGSIRASLIPALPTPAGTDRTTSVLSRTNVAGLAINASRLPDRSIQPVPGGALAEFGLLKVFFPAETKTGQPLSITTADGRTLKCRATFLALHDLASGQSLMLAEVTNRTGLIL